MSWPGKGGTRIRDHHERKTGTSLSRLPNLDEFDQTEVPVATVRLVYCGRPDVANQATELGGGYCATDQRLGQDLHGWMPQAREEAAIQRGDE
jgi:hypothetical protein